MLRLQARACRRSNPDPCVGVTMRPTLNQLRYVVEDDDSVSQLGEPCRPRQDRNARVHGAVLTSR